MLSIVYYKAQDRGCSFIAIKIREAEMKGYKTMEFHSTLPCVLYNRPFSYSTKESGSGVIFIHFYTGGLIKWRLELLSRLCKFENSIECSKISFDSDSLQNSLKGLLLS